MDELKDIKAVFFDFDDTLADREYYAYQCFKELLSSKVDIQDPIEFEAILQDCMLWDEQGNVNKQHILNGLAEKYDIRIGIDEFNEYWAGNLWKYCVPFEDAGKTLAYLSKHYHIGIITNGPSEGQRKKIMRSGLGKYFKPEDITVSGDYSFRKPDVRIFRIACDKAGVLPEEAVFVGDIFTNDVIGSYRAGMHPVWIWTHGRRCMDSNVTCIQKISDLMKIL